MNLYEYLTPKSGENFSTLLEHKNIKINRIVSASNVKSTEYIQDEDEWLVLIEGKATLLVNKEEKILQKGDTLFIPAKTPHTVLKTKEGTVWLTVHVF